MHAAATGDADRAGRAVLSSIDPQTLARLRVVVEAGQPAPPDLAWAALLAIERTAAREERIFARNQHIRRAAVLLDGSLWARACELEKESIALARIWQRLSLAQPEVMTLRGELHAAKLAYRLPGTARSFWNIIQS